MNHSIKKQIKASLVSSIRQFLRKVKKVNYQVLDDIFPQERRIRSLIGGLETSLGTTFWEPIAKVIAKANGFEIVEPKKILRPDPFPPALAAELDQLIRERENRENDRIIPTSECISRLRQIALSKDFPAITHCLPPAQGTGVDIYLKKNHREYVFDLKTTQPNLASFKSFNKQLLEWYAYKIAIRPDIQIENRIVIPFNPFRVSWYQKQQSMLSSSPLDVKQDIWVEDEFWDFCSGESNTFSQLRQLFVELGKENFAEEFKDIFYPSE